MRGLRTWSIQGIPWGMPVGLQFRAASLADRSECELAATARHGVPFEFSPGTPAQVCVPNLCELISL